MPRLPTAQALMNRDDICFPGKFCHDLWCANSITKYLRSFAGNEKEYTSYSSRFIGRLALWRGLIRLFVVVGNTVILTKRTTSLTYCPIVIIFASAIKCCLWRNVKCNALSSSIHERIGTLSEPTIDRAMVVGEFTVIVCVGCGQNFTFPCSDSTPNHGLQAHNTQGR